MMVNVDDDKVYAEQEEFNEAVNKAIEAGEFTFDGDSYAIVSDERDPGFTVDMDIEVSETLNKVYKNNK